MIFTKSVPEFEKFDFANYAEEDFNTNKTSFRLVQGVH